MCFASVFGDVDTTEGETEKIPFDKISRIEVDEQNLKLINMAGEKKSIKAEIKEIDLANSKVLIE